MNGPFSFYICPKTSFGYATAHCASYIHQNRMPYSIFQLFFIPLIRYPFHLHPPSMDIVSIYPNVVVVRV